MFICEIFCILVEQNLQDPRYQLIKEKILSVVHTDARSVLGFTPANMERCFAIRAGINDMLDIARQVYCELIDNMQSFVNKLMEKHKFSLSLSCNAALGYHIEMEVPRRRSFEIDDLPEEFIEAHKQKGKILMTTEYLAVLSKQCMDASEELHIMSNVLLNDTLSFIREHIGCLLKLNDDVAELDLLLSLAQVSAIPNYVAPVLGKRLQMIDSRHPVMDIWRTDRPVSNDIVASSAYNFHTITGPNMSGKSVYLKQIVLLQIMGQIGCHVPATKAELRITDRIFCKVCSPEDAECNASTFVLEIKEAQYILQSITPTSLVILDEICRSTTVEEGASIAWAICEKLLLTSDAFIFNATHFLYLLRLSELYPNVTNHYFETEVVDRLSNDSRLTYTHKLKTGVSHVWNYGIALARSTRLPESIVLLAQKLAETEIAKTVNPSANGQQIDSFKKLSYDCVAKLYRLVEDDEFTVGNIVKLVNELKIPSAVVNAVTLDVESRENGRSSDDEIFEKKQLAKRASTTTSSSPEIIKKSRLDTVKFPFYPVQSRATSKHSLAKSPGILSRLAVKRSPSRDHDKLSTGTTAVNPTETKITSPYIASQTSISTLDARRTAREKEARIFKVIEGNNFDDAHLRDSFSSTVTIGSDIND